MTNERWPDEITSEKLWHSVITERLSRYGTYVVKDEYVFHTRNVARFAQKLAEKIPDMDAEKAYTLGLLHDFGKRIDEAKENRFHGREGYEAMSEMGFNKIARICLTHTFHEKNFKDSDYNYSKEWLNWAHQKLSSLEYDDYDRLIQFCDMLTDGMKIVSIKGRVDGIQKRYGLSSDQASNLFSMVEKLKKYFDTRCGEDVYLILDIKE